jgi:hypothetical protein
MGSVEFNGQRLNHRLAVFVFLPSAEHNLEKPYDARSTGAQQKALDFACGGFRQFGDEAEFVRAFEAD